MNTFRRNDGVTKDPVSKEYPDCTGSIQLWDIIQVFFFFSLPTYITVIPNTCVHRPLVVSMLTIRGIGYIKGTSGAVHAQLSRRDVYVRVLSGPLTWSKSLKKAWLFHIVQRLQRHFLFFYLFKLPFSLNFCLVCIIVHLSAFRVVVGIGVTN